MKVLSAAVLVAVAVTGVLAHDPIATRVTWDREIEPIVQARCVSCHASGGRAPMSLATYEEARPWARAIREEVLTRRMPLWHVVRGYGDFANDPSLSAFEIALITAWVDGGAPKTLPARTAAPASAQPSTEWKPPVDGVQPTTVPCTVDRLPSGRILGFEPLLAEGAALRLMVSQPDGSEEPVLWIRGGDPAHRQTYWLRNPLKVSRGTRVTMDAPAGCQLTVLLEGQTAR